MAFKFVVFAAFVAVARAGIIPATYSAPLSYAAPAVAKVAYSAAPAVSYSSISSPVTAYAAAPAYANVAAPSYAYSAGPAVSYAHAAPSYGYAAPSYKVAAPLAYATPVAKEIYADTPAQYDFGYSVSDPHTGDSKTQQETRSGDVVRGSYSLIEADGSKRIVEYSADDHNGFNAVVHNEPAGVHVKAVAPVVAKVAAPVSYASPALTHAYAAPALTHAYSAPALTHAYSAPVAHTYAAPAYYH